MTTEVRTATWIEVENYLAHHREIIIDAVKGVVGVEVRRDDEGAYMLLKVREQADDERTTSLEQARVSFRWPKDNPEVQIRTKVEQVS